MNINRVPANCPQSRIALFMPAMSDGGAERVMLNLAQGIAGRAQYHVDLVLAHAGAHNTADVPAGVHVVPLNASRIVTALPALVRYLRRARPLAMLSALDPANIVALWAQRLARVPTRIIVSEHNTLSHKARNPSKPRGRMIPQLVKWFYPHAHAVVAVSKGVADDLATFTGMAREQISVIYNPVITPDVRRKAIEPLASPWFAPGEPPVILAVGRLNRQKDFPLLLRAVKRVRHQMPVRLLILGEGDERLPLEQLARQLGLDDIVAFPGYIANPYAYMTNAALFVLSSRWEGLPTVLIESLYCGTPLVATDCPSGPREILADGRYGRLVPVGDEVALADAMFAALTEYADDGVSATPEASWLPFEMDFVVEQYLKLLVPYQA